MLRGAEQRPLWPERAGERAADLGMGGRCQPDHHLQGHGREFRVDSIGLLHPWSTLSSNPQEQLLPFHSAGEADQVPRALGCPPACGDHLGPAQPSEEQLGLSDPLPTFGKFLP